MQWNELKPLVLPADPAARRIAEILNRRMADLVKYRASIAECVAIPHDPALTQEENDKLQPKHKKVFNTHDEGVNAALRREYILRHDIASYCRTFKIENPENEAVIRPLYELMKGRGAHTHGKAR
jgi:hypothetical protein